MTRIILTSLNRASHYKGLYAGSLVRTMTVKEAPPIKNIACFAPTRAMVFGHKGYPSFSKLTDAEYTEQYRAIWDKNVGEIMYWYGILPDQYTIILCCYCAPGKFCHRHLVAAWLPEIAAALGVTHEVIVD